MVDHASPGLDATFAALSDPTRRAILGRLSRGEHSVTELARPFPMSLAAVSKHIRVLSDAGLVTQRKEGRVRQCRLEPAALAAADHWFEDYRRFWSVSLERLDRLTTDDPQPSDKERTRK